MAEATYFELVHARTYRVIGPSGKHYMFFKGQCARNPVTDHKDGAAFRSRPEMFAECDKNGVLIVPLPGDAGGISTRKMASEAEIDRILRRRKITADSVKKSAPAPAPAPAEEAPKQLTQEQVVDKIIEDGGDDGPYTCILCGKELKKSSGVKRHVGSGSCVAPE